jgi:cytoskeletal protein RodZ
VKLPLFRPSSTTVNPPLIVAYRSVSPHERLVYQDGFMSRTTALIAAWIAAAIVSILIASAAVGAVRDNVSEAPQPLGSGLPSTSTTSTTTLDSIPSGSSTTTITTAPVTTSTPPTTAATLPDSSSSTSAPAAGGMLKTYTVKGGAVSIEVFPDHLTLLGAVPAAGYRVEEKSSSPQKIEIEFRSGEHESRFSAALEDDGLKISTEADEGEDE